uniref:Stromal interaction molecule 2b n=1 Tax=Haemonchus contortus TaxID=6289 RepID=A0A7I4Z5U7_HAECO
FRLAYLFYRASLDQRMPVNMKVISFVQVLCSLSLASRSPVVLKKSKLCGNEKCDEVLFKAKVKRVMDSTHEAFLPLSEGTLIDVTAIKYSDRTDLMEGVIADGTKGSFYIGAVDTGSYLEFLRNAIRLKKELKEISQSQDIGSRKLLGAVRADLHLVRDYNVEALRYAQEHGLPKPDLLPLPYEELFSVNGHRHGHSHDHSIQLGYFQTEDVGEPIGDSHSLALQLSSTLSPSDFDVHVVGSDSTRCSSYNMEFFASGMFSSDGDMVLLDGQVPTSQGRCHRSTFEESQAVLYGDDPGFTSSSGLLKSMTGAIRGVPFISTVGDAGAGFVINLSLLVAAVVFHFISYSFSDHGVSFVCDSIYEQLKSELEEERVRGLESERKQATEAEEYVTELRSRLCDVQQAHICAVNELSAVRTAMEKLEKDLSGERKFNEETAADLELAKETAMKLRLDLQCADEEIKMLKKEKRNMERENEALSFMIEEAETVRKEESGGSGGWSDFGDDIIEQMMKDDGGERERTAASSRGATPVASFTPATDIREVTKLRIQLRKTEHELEATRVALEYEKEERHQANSKVSSLENDLERRAKEVEERDRDRSRADERCNELLALVKSYNIKIRETEQLRDKLWNDIAILQAELTSRAEERRKKDEKIFDLEYELKRIRSDHLKLETKRFNEVLELKHKLDMMQTSQHMQPLALKTQCYEFSTKTEGNLSSSPTSLWEEAPRLLSCNRDTFNVTTPKEDLLGAAFTYSEKTPTRARKYDRTPLTNFPGERDKRKETSHRRVRSRSHGRLSWTEKSVDTSTRYVLVEHMIPQSCFPFTECGMEPAENCHDRAVHIYQSSGGSNGGRSPPPDMPLLGAIPPPGLQKPAGKRFNEPVLETKP